MVGNRHWSQTRRWFPGLLTCLNTGKSGGRMVKKRSCLSLGRMQQMACKTATTLFASTLHYNLVHAAQSGIDTLVSVLGAYSEESLYIPLIHHFFTSVSPSLRGQSWKGNKELLLAVLTWLGMHPCFTLQHRLALGKSETQHTSTKQAEESSCWGAHLGLLKTRTQELNTFLLFPWADSQGKALPPQSPLGKSRVAL